uniref:Uncharacterized protein n=1 Tax=Zea mays TaxID=4577 RepID=C4J8P3_MAIZE|nr:unknown [Zea mays]
MVNSHLQEYALSCKYLHYLTLIFTLPATTNKHRSYARIT